MRYLQEKNWLALSLLACFLFAITAVAGQRYVCGPNGCFLVSDAPVVQSRPIQVAPVLPDEPAKYEWSKFDDVTYWLYRGPKIIGQWYVADQTYRQWDGKTLGKTCKPPIDPPGRGAESQPKIQAWQMTGVDHSKIEGKEEIFNLAGKYNLSTEELHGAFEGKLNDDSSKGYFIVIARDNRKREEILREWNGLPEEFTRRYNVWAAAPDHFSMQDRFSSQPRFHTDGDPTIILQAPDRTILARHPLSAEQVFEPGSVKALLKADPNYRPEKDPGLPGNQSFDLSQVPIIVWIVAALIVFILIRRET